MTEDDAIRTVVDAPREKALQVAQDVVSKLPKDLREIIGPDLEEMAALRQRVG